MDCVEHVEHSLKYVQYVYMLWMYVQCDIKLEYINIWPFYAVEYADICNFADDTNPHCSSTDINERITSLEHDCNILIELFVITIWP